MIPVRPLRLPEAKLVTMVGVCLPLRHEQEPEFAIFRREHAQQNGISNRPPTAKERAEVDARHEPRRIASEDIRQLSGPNHHHQCCQCRSEKAGRQGIPVLACVAQLANSALEEAFLWPTRAITSGWRASLDEKHSCHVHSRKFTREGFGPTILEVESKQSSPLLCVRSSRSMYLRTATHGRSC